MDVPPDHQPQGAAATTQRRGRRSPLPLIGLGLWILFATLAGGEILMRMASRAGYLLLDVEMWRYAREVKQPSARPGVVLDHRPNAEAVLMGVRVRTDEHGFRRSAPELEALRTGHERVVAVIGDSCALGWGVAEGDTVGDQLERLLNESQPADRRVTVLNAGIGNSNTSMEYARYLDDVRPLHPTWVILAFFINDAELDPAPTTSPILENSALLAVLGMRIPWLLFPANRDYQSYYGGLYAPDSPTFKRFRSALEGFGKALREDGVGGTILLIPEMHKPRGFGSFAAIYHQVAALASEYGFDVVDPSGRFPEDAGRELWVTQEDSHPNAKAHAILAESLADSQHARQLREPAR